MRKKQQGKSKFEQESEESDNDKEEFKSSALAALNAIHLDPMPLNGFYKIEGFSKGSLMVCQEWKQLIISVKSMCLKEYTIVGGCFKKGSVVFHCYFANIHKYMRFPTFAPDSPCPFRMVWSLPKYKPHSTEYYCKQINPYHNHPQFTQNEIDKFTDNSSLPPSVKDEIMQLYKQGFDPTNIYEALKESYPNLRFSWNSIRVYIESENKKIRMAMTFPEVILRNIADDGMTIINNPKKERIFVTSHDRIAMWNSMSDIVFIETSEQIHPFFGLCILIITVDKQGSNCLLAASFSKEVKEDNFTWAFSKFKAQGFTDPHTIITDSNGIQYHAIKESFPSSTILFSFLRLAKNANLDVPRRGRFISSKLATLIKAETEDDLIAAWVKIMNDYPQLVRNEKLIHLYDQREQWAKFSTSNFFTAGLCNYKRLRCMEVCTREIVKSVKRDLNIKVFSQYEYLSIKDEGATSVRKLNLKSLKTLEDIMVNVNGIQFIFSDYCVLRILSAIKDLEHCSLRSIVEDDIVEVGDSAGRSPRTFEVNLDFKLCTCKRSIKYGIPCTHLLYVCKGRGVNLFQFIFENTSKRWLLIENIGKTNDELLEKAKNK